MCSGNLPVGFRFNPTDLELLRSYLFPKINQQRNFNFIEEMDVYGCDPWLLPHKANPMFKECEWYYFVRRTRASDNSHTKRPRRSVTGNGKGGTWKATDGEVPIYDQNNNTVGYKQSLTFFIKKEGKKNGTKTDWIMKEYRLVSNTFQEWVICRIRLKTKKRPVFANNPVPAGTSDPSVDLEDMTGNGDFISYPNVPVNADGSMFVEYYRGILGGHGEEPGLNLENIESSDDICTST